MSSGSGMGKRRRRKRILWSDNGRSFLQIHRYFFREFDPHVQSSSKEGKKFSLSTILSFTE
jgi:hypothetical protein